MLTARSSAVISILTAASLTLKGFKVSFVIICQIESQYTTDLDETLYADSLYCKELP